MVGVLQVFSPELILYSLVILAIYLLSSDCSIHPHDAIFQVPDHLRVEDFSSSKLPVILTADAQRSLDFFSLWLNQGQEEPFLLVGPDGCGKE